MLKAGIFLDSDNLSYNGGWRMQFSVIKALVKAQDAVVLRANAYMARDSMHETQDSDYRTKKEEFRQAMRRHGFHLVLKETKRYYNEDEGQVVLKANADLDLAVDALLQSDNLDYILLGSGDGDFLRLVRALQNKGKRVDVLAFNNVSRELREEADHFFCGPLIPGLLPSNGGEMRYRGIMHQVLDDKGYGFLMVRTGLGIDDVLYDVFLHITQFTEEGRPINNYQFAKLCQNNTIIEFDLDQEQDGKYKGRFSAKSACEYKQNGPRSPKVDTVTSDPSAPLLKAVL